MPADDECDDGEGYGGWADRNAYEEAEKRGLEVRLPAEDELFVDIDDEASLALFEETLKILNRDAAVDATYTMTPSPSGEPHHFHVVVKWPEPIEDERVRLGLQAILGSDRKREALCWLRHENGDEPVTVFFEKKSVPPPAPAPGPVAPAPPAPLPAREPYRAPHWVEFEDRVSGTVEGYTVEDATEAARAFGTPKRVRILPYPAEPRIAVASKCPSFCFAPRECAGNSACPQRRACSE